MFNSDDLFTRFSPETTTKQQEDTTVKTTETVNPPTNVANEVVSSSVTDVTSVEETAKIEKIDSVNIQKCNVELTNGASDVQISEVVEKEDTREIFPSNPNEQKTTENGLPLEKTTEPVESDIASSLFEKLALQADEAQKSKDDAIAKKKATKKKPASTSTNVTSEAFNVNADTTIRYHREVLSILDFFTIEEVENGVKITKNDETVEYTKIDGEMVRERMEKNGYLEFVKGFSQFNYFGEDRNFIVPSTISKKKGNISIKEKEVRSPSDSTSFLFQYDTKIPFSILGQFIALAKMLGRLKLEVLAEIYFNYDTNEFMLHIPKQQVNDLWCISKESPGEFQRKMLEDRGQYVELACEIHSHHEMPCYPSSTDDAGERKPKMFYVIVGETHKDIPCVYARTFTIDGFHVEKNFKDIFSNDGVNDNKSLMTLPHFKASWIDIVR